MQFILKYSLIIILISIPYLWAKDDPYFKYHLQHSIITDRYKDLKAEYQLSQKHGRISIKPSGSLEAKSHKPSRGSYSHQQFISLLQRNAIKYKSDARFDGMHTKWGSLLSQLKKIFKNESLIITSGTDGHNHIKSEKSHYTGHKIDIRVKNLKGVKIKNRKVVAGRAHLNELLDQMSQLDGVTAILEEGVNYPHFDISIY